MGQGPPSILVSNFEPCWRQRFPDVLPFSQKKIARKAGLWESALALLERADPDAWTFNEILCDTRSQNLV